MERNYVYYGTEKIVAVFRWGLKTASLKTASLKAASPKTASLKTASLRPFAKHFIKFNKRI